MGCLKLTYHQDNTNASNLRVAYKSDCKNQRNPETKTSEKLRSDYLVGGMLMPGRNYQPSNYRYGMNGQEKDDEITGVTGAHYTAQYWEYDSRTIRRWNIDPKPNPSISSYNCFAGNPIGFRDPLGDTVWVFATTLPGAPENALINKATHTFIMVKTQDNQIHYYAYGAKNGDPFGGDQLVRIKEGEFPQDINVMKGKDEEHLKKIIPINAPKGMSIEEFDQSVIKAAESFGNNPNIKYNALTESDVTGNCHTSTSTILYKAGVSEETIDDIEDEIPGLNWGFGDIKPWTKGEQAKAVAVEKKNEAKRKEEVERRKTIGGQWGDIGNK